MMTISDLKNNPFRTHQYQEPKLYSASTQKYFQYLFRQYTNVEKDFTQEFIGKDCVCIQRTLCSRKSSLQTYKESSQLRRHSKIPYRGK